MERILRTILLRPLTDKHVEGERRNSPTDEFELQAASDESKVRFLIEVNCVKIYYPILGRTSEVNLSQIIRVLNFPTRLYYYFFLNRRYYRNHVHAFFDSIPAISKIRNLK